MCAKLKISTNTYGYKQNNYQQKKGQIASPSFLKCKLSIPQYPIPNFKPTVPAKRAPLNLLSAQR